LVRRVERTCPAAPPWRLIVTKDWPQSCAKTSSAARRRPVRAAMRKRCQSQPRGKGMGTKALLAAPRWYPRPPIERFQKKWLPLFRFGSGTKQRPSATFFVLSKKGKALAPTERRTLAVSHSFSHPAINAGNPALPPPLPSVRSCQSFPEPPTRSSHCFLASLLGQPVPTFPDLLLLISPPIKHEGPRIDSAGPRHQGAA